MWGKCHKTNDENYNTNIEITSHWDHQVSNTQIKTVTYAKAINNVIQKLT